MPNLLSKESIKVNSLFIIYFIQPQLDRRAIMLAGGCQFTADELLVQEVESFTCNFVCLNEERSVKYGRLCLLRAARDARRGWRWHRLDQLRDAGWDAAAEDLDIESRLNLAGWSNLLDCAISRWGCEGLRAFGTAIQAGMDLVEATRATGLTEVQVARVICFLTKKLAGWPTSRVKPSRELDDQQLVLFAVGQGG